MSIINSCLLAPICHMFLSSPDKPMIWLNSFCDLVIEFYWNFFSFFLFASTGMNVSEAVYIILSWTPSYASCFFNSFHDSYFMSPRIHHFSDYIHSSFNVICLSYIIYSWFVITSWHTLYAWFLGFPIFLNWFLSFSLLVITFVTS